MHTNKLPERSRLKGLSKRISTVVLGVNIGNFQTAILNKFLDEVVQHINVLAPRNQLPISGPINRTLVVTLDGDGRTREPKVTVQFL